jgi:hypothetical protein
MDHYPATLKDIWIDRGHADIISRHCSGIDKRPLGATNCEAYGSGTDIYTILIKRDISIEGITSIQLTVILG